MSDNERLVLDLLAGGVALPLGALEAEGGLPRADLLRALLGLELARRARRLPGDRFEEAS